MSSARQMNADARAVHTFMPGGIGRGAASGLAPQESRQIKHFLRAKTPSSCTNKGLGMRRVFLSIAALAACSGITHADDDTDTFTVSATVLATCEVSANDLSFGDYDPVAATHLDASTTLSVTCTNGTPYQVALELGPGATTAARRMLDGSEVLNYTLYRDAARTQLWGQTNGSNTLAGSGSGSAATIDVYGRVPMQQAAPSGTYEDTITVKVEW